MAAFQKISLCKISSNSKAFRLSDGRRRRQVMEGGEYLGWDWDWSFHSHLGSGLGSSFGWGLRKEKHGRHRTEGRGKCKNKMHTHGTATPESINCDLVLATLHRRLDQFMKFSVAFTYSLLGTQQHLMK